MTLIQRTVWLLALIGWLAPAATAQMEAEGTLYTRTEDDLVRAVVQIQVSPDWHLYHTDLGHPEGVGKPLSIELRGEGIEWGEPRVSEPETYAEDPERGVFVNVHHGLVTIWALGVLDPGAEDLDALVYLEGLTCQTDGLCIPYEEELESEGAGSDKIFADFPDDLTRPGPAAATGTGGAETPGDFGGVGISAFGAGALGGGDDGKVSAELFLRRGEDGTARAIVRARIAPDWHIYHGPDREDIGEREPVAEPTLVELEGGTWEPVIYPQPITYEKGISGIDFEEIPIQIHEGTVLFHATGELGADEELTARLVGQACDPLTCIPVSLELAAQGEGPDELFASFPQVTAPPASQGEGGGLGGLILKAILGGLITLLMPCTYPMIPITISFFTKQAMARDGNVLPLSLAYGAGIVLIFMLIGAVVGPVILTFATHPVTNLVIGAMFLFFAFVLFGGITLNPPTWLMSAAGKAQMKGGLFGVFLMGATLVITSFTCTAPIVGSLLTASAVGGDTGLFEIVVGMGVFGFTMAVPFVVLSLVPGKLQRMQGSAGEWMDVLKVFLGFVELAASLKFFSNSDVIWKWGILSREIFLMAWFGIFLVAALFLWNQIKLKGESEDRIGAGRLTGGLLSFLFSLYCGMGVIGYQLDDIMTAIIPPYSSERLAGIGGGAAAGGHASEQGHVIVEDDLELAKATAVEEDKLVLVNFTGHT